MSFCGECGAEVKSSDKFCRNCGNKNDFESNPVVPDTPDDTEPQAEEVVEELGPGHVEEDEDNNHGKDVSDKRLINDNNYLNKRNIKIAIPIVLILLVPTVIYPYYHVWSANVDSIDAPLSTMGDFGMGFSPGSEDLLAVFWHDMDKLSMEYSLNKFDLVYEYQIYAKSTHGYDPYSEITEDDLILEESCKFSIDSECKLQLVPMENDRCWVPWYSPLYIGYDNNGGSWSLLYANALMAECGMTYDSEIPFYLYSEFGIVENNYNIYDSGSENGDSFHLLLKIFFSIETKGIVSALPSGLGGATIKISMLDYDFDGVNDYDDDCPREYAKTSNGCP